MSEFWHKLGCCVVEKPQPKKKRRRIDRTMIGEPMNFVHLTHIGSGEMGGPSFPCLSLSASEGLGAGLPFLPLVAAPPGDGVKAAGLTT
uniref:CDC42 small effector protein 1 n=1 Tax=Moschus moschiferus TaxID=68415 RepID=A0A8C6FKV3_MOSMO